MDANTIEQAIQIAIRHAKGWEKLSSRYPDKNRIFSNPESLSADTIMYAYPDGKGYSIGWGSYGTLSDGRRVVKGMSITKEQADYEIEWEMRKKEAELRKKIKRNLTANEYAAMLDVAYNAGVGAVEYRDLIDYVNNGQDISGVITKVAITDSATGKVLPVLVNRRKDALALYNGKYNALYHYYLKNAQTINYAVIGVLLIAMTGYIYWLNKKGILKKIA